MDDEGGPAMNEDTSEFDPSARTEETEPVAAKPRRNWSGIAVLTVAGLLVVAAVGIAASGMGARADASDQREQAATARTTSRALAVKQGHARDARDKIEQLEKAMPAKSDALGSAFDALAASQNHFIDLTAQSAQLFNSGDEAGSANLYRGDGAAALTDMQQKNTVLQQATKDVRAALTALQGAL